MGKVFHFAPAEYSLGRREIKDQYGTYFLTLTVTGWVDLFTRAKCRNIILKNLSYCQQSKGLLLFGYVLMSNHLHLLAAASEESSGLSGILRDFKSYTSKRMAEVVAQYPGEYRRSWMKPIFSQGETDDRAPHGYRIWQAGNWPVHCYSRKFLRQKLRYIHLNPVRAGIVDRATDYRLSSARNYAGRRDYILKVIVLDLD